MGSSQLALLYSYISQSVCRRDWLHPERLLPAGGTLQKIEKNGKIYWYKRFYHNGRQHSAFLGLDENVGKLIEQEKDALQRDVYINDYLLSMRNMGFSMPLMKSQKIMKALARLGFLNIEGVIRVDDGVINAYAGHFGDDSLARKLNEKLKKDKEILEFYIPKEYLKKAKKIIKDIYDFSDCIKIKNVPDYIIDNSNLEVFLSVPCIKMNVPEIEYFIKWKKEIGQFGKIEKILEENL